MSISKAADHMLITGRYYTAKSIAKEFRVSVSRGVTWINTIQAESRYKTISADNGEGVKVVEVDGRKRTLEQVQKTALLFGRPSMLVD